MRKIFLSFVIVFFLSLFVVQASFAARYTTCDACGLCPKIDVESGTCTIDSTVQVPGDWKQCVKCLYPALYPAASSPTPDNACKTLLMTEDNVPANPVQTGRQFTMLGCITSGSNIGFNGATGAPSFVQALLNVIFSLSGGLALFYLMYGGFVIITSQADPERLNYGKRLVSGAVVGLIITLGSVLLINLIGSGILHIPGFSGTL